MDTLVTVEIIGCRTNETGASAAGRAFEWFRAVEAHCNRFDPTSEVRRLSERIGQAVPVSPLLFEAVRFALAVARDSRGAFDPTIGVAQERRGFQRDYRTGRETASGLEPAAPPTYRDVRLNPARRTVTLRQPLILDLGAVAKGLAIDLAAKELADFPGYAVEAGGDLFVHGKNAAGESWRIGIRHPHDPEAICAVLGVSDAAVCTSGGYERPAPEDAGHHLLDPRSGRSPSQAASCTVVASAAMVADALATAAFVLGPPAAIPWLERQGAEGLLITSALERHATRGFARYEQCT